MKRKYEFYANNCKKLNISSIVTLIRFVFAHAQFKSNKSSSFIIIFPN